MTNIMKRFIACLLAAISTTTLSAQIEKPTMGWSSWNTFFSNISEQTIKAQAAAMVSQGYAKVGYQYINIDDGFQGGRNKETGELLIHPKRFPNGLRGVVDYIHSKGLKAGIYSDAGRNTCANFYGGDELSVDVGMYQYDERDAKFFFDTLDFDFIKVDFCGGTSWQNTYHEDLDPRERYTAIHDAIMKCEKKDIRFNVCRWNYPGTWVHDISTSWRMSQDINASWGSVKDIIGQNLYLSAYCYGGCYNDMDMLEVGRGLSVEEDKTHFGIWCIMASPLLIGCDMTSVNTTAKALMQNAELIALNQDELGLQAYVAAAGNGTYTLVKDIETLYGNTRAVALYNPTDQATTMTLDFGDVDLGGNVKVRDLFTRRDVGTYTGTYSIQVPAHGTRIYRLEAEKRYERELYEAETAYLSRYQELENNQSYISGTYDKMDAASGGMIAGWLGNRADNDLVWPHVYSREGGDYTLTLSYISGDSRKTIITTNGQQAYSGSLNSGGWGNIKQLTLKVKLKAGDNVVRIYTDDGNWLPNIDCMKIRRDGSTEATEKQFSTLRSQLQAIDGQPMTEAIRQTYQQLLEETSTLPDDATTLTAMCDDMQKFMDTHAAMVDVCRDFDIWHKSAVANAEASKDTEALTTLLTAMATAQEAFDASTTKTKASSALTSLRTALRNYLRSDDAIPKDGQTFDMTLLINNSDMSLTSGWTGTPTYANGVAEVWNKAFNVYQTLANMKPGHYRITCQALYRTKANDGGADYRAKTEVIPAKLYANKDSVAVASLYKYKLANASTYSDVDAKNGYANSTTTASVAFDRKAYTNTLNTTLETKGTLKIGITSKVAEADCWCCFDSFTLTYTPLETEDAIRNIPTTQTSHTTPAYRLDGRKASSHDKGIIVRNGKKSVRK